MAIKLLTILLFASTCFGQIQQHYLAVIAKKNTYSLLANNYRARVIADGGSVINMDSVDNTYNNALTNDYYDSLKTWIGVYFGIKKDANNKITKLYDLTVNGNDWIQTDTSKSFSYIDGTIDSIYGNNKSMPFTTAITTIRSIFWVISDLEPDYDNPRPLLGHSSTYDFNRGNTGVYLNTDFANAYVKTGDFRYNGVLQAANYGTNNVMPKIKQLVGIITTGNVEANEFQRDRNAADRAWIGSFWEIMIGDIPFSTTKCALIESYLNAKYSIY